MSAVDMRRVKKHCLLALLQTMIRDLAAIAVVAACLIIEPWGTAITLGIVAAIFIYAGRAGFFLLLLTAVTVCVALALVNGSTKERLALGPPLACLAGCFIIYLADVLLSIHHVRKIWRQPAAAHKFRSAEKSRLLGRAVSFREPARSESQRWLYASGNGNGSTGYSHNGHGSNVHEGNEGYSGDRDVM